MAIQIPYKFVSPPKGVPGPAWRETARQLWRDFEYVIKNLPGSTSPYDATIDPAQTTADPSNHVYPNLATLVANEDWDSTHCFTVGVVNRETTPIVEAACTIPGPIAVVALGIAGGDLVEWAGSATTNRPDWQFNGQVTSNFAIYIEGMKIRRPSGSMTRFFLSDTVFFNNCIVQGTDTNGTTRLVTNPTSGATLAINTLFQEIAFANTAFMHGCHLRYGDVNSGLTISSTNFWCIAGTLTVPSVSQTYTFGGSDIYLDLVRAGSGPTGGAGTGVATLSFAGTNSDVYLRHAAGVTPGLNVSVASGVDHAVIEGVFNNVTLSGNTEQGSAVVRATITGTADITGPAEIDIASRKGATSMQTRVIVRGSGVRGNVQIASTGNFPTAPALDLIGADDCLITATLRHDGAGAPTLPKAYAIDVNSDRSILIVSGANTGWPVASTNASATSIVIDETGSPAAGTAGGDLSGTYPNPTVDGIQGRAIASTAPADLDYLGWNAGASQWEPKSLGAAALDEVLAWMGVYD